MPRNVLSADPPITLDGQTYFLGAYCVWPADNVHTKRKPMDVSCSCGVHERAKALGVKVTRHSCEHLSTLVGWLEDDRAQQREVFDIYRRWRARELTPGAARDELRELAAAGNPHAEVPASHFDERLSEEPLFVNRDDAPDLAQELFG
jgi:hypothetical protein